ncbi:SnoaL-like protein [Bosea sp. 62]|uniref:nuclear transport factor 2 family protein n=1 Tax=unclassified Bosea (in: a-proteobacteria) TaxID=2653178 RepID=UPI0012597529|nr:MULTISPECIES: nuclear transport factor 2 family protein [unclassified Bosea (in: a-proteobacteria)]CAD5266697.1 SnoaL-like protein [Bosea sp. 46]CAD5268215.1 SnoaL-like protein [Bosea sp. 21B]CAD5270430.1 SnoaL-like protein [Bosea sp. 7B]VVT62379.1 Ketosteroid isomerase [Bosea sp. EC-HK365B]VXB90376.1 SnoaL-like protein [Bosea sp. 29B]
MTETAQLAADFVALLKEGKHEDAARSYNADDIASYENMPGPMAECHGKQAVKGKGEWWTANHEVHEFTTAGPYLNGDQFAVHFYFDVTVKESGERRKMHEIGLYTVKDGKIAEERFFY